MLQHPTLNALRDFRQRRGKDTTGFTLVELLIVMVIIGVIAAIAIPAFLNQQKTAKDTSVVSDVKNLSTEVTSLLKYDPDARPLKIEKKNDGIAILTVGQETSEVTYSKGTRMNIIPGREPGSFMICGWNPKGKVYHTNALTYDSSRGGLTGNLVHREECGQYNAPPWEYVSIGDYVDGGDKITDGPISLPDAGGQRPDRDVSGGEDIGDNRPTGPGNGGGGGGNGDGDGDGDGGNGEPTEPPVTGLRPDANADDFTWFPWAGAEYKGNTTFGNRVLHSQNPDTGNMNPRNNWFLSPTRGNYGTFVQWGMNNPTGTQYTSSVTITGLDKDGKVVASAIKNDIESGANIGSTITFSRFGFPASGSRPRTDIAYMGVTVEIFERRGEQRQVIKAYREYKNPHVS